MIRYDIETLSPGTRFQSWVQLDRGSTLDEAFTADVLIEFTGAAGSLEEDRRRLLAVASRCRRRMEGKRMSERYESQRAALDEHIRAWRRGQKFSEDLADKLAAQRESGQPVSKEEEVTDGVTLIEGHVRWKREAIDTAVAFAEACEPNGPEPGLLNGAAPVEALWRATRRELANGLLDELAADERRHQIAVRALIENDHDADGGPEITTDYCANILAASTTLLNYLEEKKADQLRDTILGDAQSVANGSATSFTEVMAGGGLRRTVAITFDNNNTAAEAPVAENLVSPGWKGRWRRLWQR